MKFNICVLDRSSDWCEAIQEVAGALYEIHFYNPDGVTYCCEMTPSYEMNLLGTIPRDLPGEERMAEKLLEEIEEAISWVDLISYIHCRNIDKLPSIKRGELKQGTYFYGEYEDEKEAREYWNGNPDY